jgi:hypothetical protein
VKTAILLFLFMNLFVNDVKADAFLDLCYAKNTGKDQSEHIAWLKSNFGKKQCRNVHNEIKKVKSLTELIVPTIAIYLKAKKSWVQNFNYMYGFGDAEKLNSWPTLSYNPFLTGKGLDIYKDFKNIMHLSYTPEYQFTKNYTLCEAIKHFPHLKEITINSSELEKPSSDVCISERNIAVVIRNEFYGFKEIPQSIIIGFEDYRDNFANLINYPRVKYLGISQYLETQGSIKTLSQRMNISHLTLNLNGIQDIEKISKLINIRFLGIYCTKFSRSTIPDYSGESDFGCKKNHLTDITFLEEMTWLNYLNLESNKIKDIQVLKKLIHLEKVILNNNEISEVPDFSSLEKLNHLELRSNDLTNLNNLEKISNLNFLDGKRSIKPWI